MVNQIKKNSKDIQAFLSDIENVNLYPTPDANLDGSLLQCKVLIIGSFLIQINSFTYEKMI